MKNLSSKKSINASLSIGAAPVLIIPLFLPFILQGCGKAKDTTPSQSVAISDLASAPKSTDTVAASSTSSTSGRFKLDSARAVTGQVLGNMSNVTWTTNKSRAFCESADIVRNLMREAGNADKTLCYMGVMQKAGLFTNLDDGKVKYITLTGAVAGVTATIKSQVSKASDGSLSKFEMWSCFGSDSQQDAYVKEDFSVAGKATIVSVASRGDSNTGGSSRLTGVGTLNSSGQWTSKTLTGQTHFSLLGIASFNQYAEVTQAASDLTISAYRTGSATFLNQTSSMEDQFYAKMDYLGSELSTLAIGDGSAKFSVKRTANSSTSTVDGTVSWNGDTGDRLLPFSSGAYYTAVSDVTLPAVGTPSTGFDSTKGETFDCKIPTGVSADYTVNLLLHRSDKLADGKTVLQSLAACDTKYVLESSVGIVRCDDADH